MHNFQSLPYCIKHLDIRSLMCPSAIILALLRSYCLPYLRRRQYWDDESIYDEDGGWSDEGREEVVALLEKLGISGERWWEGQDDEDDEDDEEAEDDEVSISPVLLALKLS